MSGRIPARIHRQVNLQQYPVRELSNMLEAKETNAQWNRRTQQYVFNRAIELYGRNASTLSQRALARRILLRLANNYGRRWTNHPTPNRIMNNVNRNSQLNSNSNNSISGYNSMNSHNSSSSPPAWAALRASNYSKASTVVKKWLAMRPHIVHRNMVEVKLPAKAKDPASWHNFAPGNEAVMVIKKHVDSKGFVRSKRTFYQKNTIERLSGKNWNTIMRMKGSDVVLNKDPLNRRTVYRRDLMNVKFMA